MKSKIHEKGITLIALVLTIIILLILAGVTISIVFNGGIINKSQTAVEAYHIQEDKEKIELAKAEVSFNNLGEIPVEELKEALIKYKFTICDDITEFEGETLTEKQFVVKCPNNKHMYLVTAEKITNSEEKTKPQIESISVENEKINLFDDVTTTFTANITGKGDYTLQWYYENETIEGATNEIYKITTAEMNEKTYLGGTYKCILTYEEESSEKEASQTVEYTISNAEQMSNFAKRVNNQEITFATLKEKGGEVTLTTDIDLSTVCGSNVNGKEINWIPIGDYGTNNNLYFAGTFNGNNHTINNLYIIDSSKDYQGLFGYTNNSNIERIIIENIKITGQHNVGGIVGFGNNSKIENVHINSGEISGYSSVGGISGLISGTIKQCSNKSNISTTCITYVSAPAAGGFGGITGVGDGKSKIELCVNHGTIGGQRYSGGIVGVNWCETINCYNTGNIEPILTKNCFGGIAGIENSGTGKIKNCYSIGKIGDIVAEKNGGQIIGVSSDLSRDENSNITGVNNNNVTTSNCYYLEGQNIQGISNTNVPGRAEAKYAVYMKTSDFVNVLNAGDNNWKLVDGKNNNFPVLNWEEGTAIIREGYAEYSNLDSTGYDVYSYFGGGTETKVEFPTWTELNGQDDLIWHTAENLGNGVYHYRIKKSEHNNESGIYYTHVYYWKSDGSTTFTGGIGCKVP